jgi:hypothetical protein
MPARPHGSSLNWHASCTRKPSSSPNVSGEARVTAQREYPEAKFCSTRRELEHAGSVGQWRYFVCPMTRAGRACELRGSASTTKSLNELDRCGTIGVADLSAVVRAVRVAACRVAASSRRPYRNGLGGFFDPLARGAQE